jgi:fructose-bisphosphate aldolase, class I
VGAVNASDLHATAEAMVAGGKGILAADESSGTIARRFADIGIESTEENRRGYREALFGAPGLERYISGVILYDETIRQKMSDGTPMPRYLTAHGMIPGIKVDKGLVPLRPDSKEQVTEGLDGLNGRLVEYRELGARFAKWRAVYHIGDGIPTQPSIAVSAWLLARYARVCQDNGIVPIVEPEVLMDGDHAMGRDAEVTRSVLGAVFGQLRSHDVDLRGMVLKPNMVTPGSRVFGSATPAEIARATVDVLRECVPAEVPGIAFLSGGQTEEEATANLDEVARLGPHPWHITFSFGRALQASALREWAGQASRQEQARQALIERASQNSRVLLAAAR